MNTHIHELTYVYIYICMYIYIYICTYHQIPPGWQSQLALMGYEQG